MKQTRFKANILSLAIKHSLLAATVVGTSINSVSVFANTTIQNIQISSGSLAQVVNQFAEQTGILLTYDAKLLEGKQSAGLKGSYDIESGFTSLLSQHDLQLQKTATGYTIIAKPQSQQQTRDVGQLKKIDVTATQSTNSNVAQLPLITLNGDSNTTEGTSSYTTGKMSTATKLNLSIRETPQSVMVISQQMLQDRKIDDFQSLMQKTTGITAEKNADGRYVYYSRGFDVDYYLFDGIPITQGWYTINNYNLDLFDRVEIVKGANGLLAGAGNPAVSINMIRKHANSRELNAYIEASAGRWDMYKLKTDIQTPLNEDASVRARLVASYKNKDLFIDKASQKNSLIYAVIDADITENTQLSFGVSQEENNNDGIMGGKILPTFFSDGTKTDFNRSKSYMFDWSKWHTSINSYFIDAKHYFDNNVSLNLSYFYNEIETKDRSVTDISGVLNKDGTGLTATDSKYPQFIKKKQC